MTTINYSVAQWESLPHAPWRGDTVRIGGQLYSTSDVSEVASQLSIDAITPATIRLTLTAVACAPVVESPLSPGVMASLATEIADWHSSVSGRMCFVPRDLSEVALVRSLDIELVDANVFGHRLRKFGDPAEIKQTIAAMRMAIVHDLPEPDGSELSRTHRGPLAALQL